MPKIGKIDATLTQAAKSEMEKFLSICSPEIEYIGLVKWSDEEGGEEQWTYGGYTRTQIESAAIDIEAHGLTVLYELDDMIIAFDQPHLLDKLQGSEIDVEPGRLIVRK